MGAYSSVLVLKIRVCKFWNEVSFRDHGANREESRINKERDTESLVTF